MLKVTTPPRPSRSDCEAALRRIHERRRAAGDDHPLALSEDPREVLAYLRQRGRQGLVADTSGDDVTDALTLRLYLWWEGEATELWLLEAAEALGRNRRVIGSALGLSSGQGLKDRIERKQAMLGRVPVDAEPPRIPAAPPGRLREIAVAALAHRAEMPDEVADGFEVDQLVDLLPRWPVDADAPLAGVNALRFLLGDLVDVVPAGTALRAIVDEGADLIGTRKA
jgi:hypothetical protein